jgi:hypothetical protein
MRAHQPGASGNQVHIRRVLNKKEEQKGLHKVFSERFKKVNWPKTTAKERLFGQR